MAEPRHNPDIGPSLAEIGGWLQKWRKAAKARAVGSDKKRYTQQGAARYLDINDQTVSDWENGRYEMGVWYFFALFRYYAPSDFDLLDLIRGKSADETQAVKRRRRPA